MTIPRQKRKSLPRRGFVACLAAGFGGILLAPARVRAAALSAIVTDERSGLAIYGFDPVGYFTAATAQLGDPEFELRHAGAVWRFRNSGNRSAFAANPEIYMPCYGGHDPISVGRGASAAGHPRLWMIARERLYLFYSEAARTAFVDNTDLAIEAADRHWPEVLRTLVP